LGHLISFMATSFKIFLYFIIPFFPLNEKQQAVSLLFVEGINILSPLSSEGSIEKIFLAVS
jgi:hypothetical protein